MTCAQPRLRSALALTKSGQSLWVAKDPNFLQADREDSDADLSLRWAQMSFCWFCRALTLIFIIRVRNELSKTLVRCS